MIAGHFLLLWLRQALTAFYRFFSLLFLDHQINDMLLDQLMIFYQTALHH